MTDSATKSVMDLERGDEVAVDGRERTYTVIVAPENVHSRESLKVEDDFGYPVWLDVGEVEPVQSDSEHSTEDN
jgi:hypothetical protein